MKRIIFISLVTTLVAYVQLLCAYNVNAQTSKIANSGMNPKIVSTIGKNVQEFVELIDASAERDRLGLRSFIGTDFVPTGFYLPPNATLKLDVQQLRGETLPAIIIGTYNLFENKNPQTEKLKAGTNAIKANPKGGLIWVRYTSGNPESCAKIDFKSGHVKAPTFIKGITSQSDWDTQLKNSKSTDVLLLGNRAIQVYSLKYARSINPQDNDFVLETADKIWDWQNEFSGIDGSSELNKPHAHNRFLMVETANITAAAYASVYGTAYGPGTLAGAFTKEITGEAWATWHELGHEKQQLLWTWGNMTEVTVNLYTLYVERKLGIKPGRLHRENRFSDAFNFLHDNDDPGKDFNTMTGTYNDHFTRLVMFHQLYLAFGDSFYKQIHQRARLEKRDNKMSDLDKQKWFICTACKVSRSDLSSFFKKWGFNMGDVFYDEIAVLKLKKPTEDLTMLQDIRPDTTIISNSVYKIASSRTFTFDVNSNNVFMYQFHGGNNQKWYLKQTGDGYYTIISLSTGQAVGVKNANITAGGEVNIEKFTNGDNQKWKIEHRFNGKFTLSPKHAPHMNLDLKDQKVKNGTKLIINKKSKDANQLFLLNQL